MGWRFQSTNKKKNLVTVLTTQTIESLYYCGIAGFRLIKKRLGCIEYTFLKFVGYIICV